jgi:Polyphosphate kinase 2 (PPK2)
VDEAGRRVAVLFEGRNAVGKGSTIKHFTEHLNPRGARVVALEVPTERERGQWHFQRYAEHLPTAGEIVLFDRSWHNHEAVGCPDELIVGAPASLNEAGGDELFAHPDRSGRQPHVPKPPSLLWLAGTVVCWAPAVSLLGGQAAG